MQASLVGIRVATAFRQMTLRPKRKHTIGIAISQAFEDILAFANTESLQFQAIDDLIAQLIQRLPPSQTMALSAHDHLPEKHSCNIVSGRPKT